MFPLKEYKLPVPQGMFGAVRKHDIHTGVDFYCTPNTNVRAIEQGVVVNVVPFTGQFAGSDWWYNTWAVLVKGKSGVILYGEVMPHAEVGDKVQAGDVVGYVLPVLKEDKGNGTSMLHLELYKKNYTGHGEIWHIKKKQPSMLLNPNQIKDGEFLQVMNNIYMDDKETAPGRNG